MASIALGVRNKTDAWIEDGMFDHLIGLVESQDNFSLPITLTISGSVVAGDLIGTAAWLMEYSRSWQRLVGTMTNPFADVLTQEAATVTQDLAVMAPQERARRAFVHLKDAHFVFGGEVAPSGQGLLWRCQRSAVTGFSLGKISVEKSTLAEALQSLNRYAPKAK